MESALADLLEGPGFREGSQGGLCSQEFRHLHKGKAKQKLSEAMDKMARHHGQPCGENEQDRGTDVGTQQILATEKHPDPSIDSLD